MSDAAGDLRRAWRPLVLTDGACKLVAFAIVAPLTMALLRWALARTGAAAVTDTDIAAFFLGSRQGLIALLLISIVTVAMVATELACAMAVGLTTADGERPDVMGALAFGAERAPATLRLAARVVGGAILTAIPFAAIAGLTYWVLLRAHDINYYLANRPPEFWIAGGVAVSLAAGLAAVVVRTAGRWALALPIVLFERVPTRRAIAESTARAAVHGVSPANALVAWAIAASASLALAAWVPQTVGRAVAPHLSASRDQLVIFVTALALFWILAVLAASIFNAVLLALILLRMYRTTGEAPPTWRAARGQARRAQGRVRPLVGAGLALTAVIAAGTLAVGAMGTAAERRDVAVIAHRGAAIAAPENTLAAFRLGAEHGADFVELDVQESADDQVVVVHDSDLMKVGGSPLKIWEATAAELRAVDIGSHKAPEFAGERVPTLAEALATCRDRVGVIVELKTYGHGRRLEQRVVEIVDASGMADRTVFMSLDLAMARTVKQLRPAWRVGVLSAKAIGNLASLDTDFFAVHASLATAGFIEQAHRAGRDVYAWTVNDPALMVSLMSRGVDGLITDAPDVARRVVDWRDQMSAEERVMLALLVRLGVRTDDLAAAAAAQ